MKSLTSYLKGQFTVNGTSSSKILIFDVDDTLINTTANIWIMKGGKRYKTITNKEFNDYTLKDGETFDFREFDDPKILSKETFTKYWNTLKREYKKGTHISILTARTDASMIRRFFLKNGIDIKESLVFAIGGNNMTGSIQSRKALIIRELARLGYDTMVFFDDNEHNLNAAKALENTLNIKIHTVKA